MKEIMIAPSILAADITKMGDEVKKVEAAGAKVLHIDIMDGHFVPNLSFSPQLVKSLRPLTEMFFDVHLMLSEPNRYIEAFAQAGADLITVHYEAAGDTKTLKTWIDQIHALGVKAGVSLKPNTPASVLKGLLSKLELVLVMSVEPGFGGQSYILSANEKIAQVKAMAEEENPDLILEVDGGVKAQTVQAPAAAGATLLVAGSSVFGAEDMKYAMDEMLQLASEAVKE